ncbi:DUF805 domain-containing protein [Chthonobacter albigriseus]|uniref:DUF805 domain-containing protein n=1 Tax=Chthonobacter albigriseus TaxID=1683161 RepID=UPI0015EE99B8|nr:DUF805 domain-containing protein [Chthonobacter albigriseus]
MASIFFSWRGRIGRAVYWLCSIPLFLVGTGAVAAIVIDLQDDDLRTSTVVLAGFLLLVNVYCSFAIQAKRWHDRDKSALWILMNFVPYVGSLWVFVECGFLRGTDGPNRFDLDPSERREVDALVREEVTARIIRKSAEEYQSRPAPVPVAEGWSKPAGWQPGARPTFGKRGL